MLHPSLFTLPHLLGHRFVVVVCPQASPICAKVGCFLHCPHKCTVPASALPNGGHLPLSQPRSEQIEQCLHGERTEGLRGKNPAAICRGVFLTIGIQCAV